MSTCIEGKSVNFSNFGGSIQPETSKQAGPWVPLWGVSSVLFTYYFVHTNAKYLSNKKNKANGAGTLSRQIASAGSSPYSERFNIHFELSLRSGLKAKAQLDA